MERDGRALWLESLEGGLEKRETLAAQHDGDTAGNGTTRDRSLRVLDRRPASLAHRTVLSVPIKGVPRWLTTRRINVRSHASQDA